VTVEFTSGFFDRADEFPDRYFYSPPRLVTHIDDQAIDALGRLYRDLGVSGHVLDLMSSWVSHFAEPPRRLCVLGMNHGELAYNPQAHDRVIHDLNDTPTLPFDDDSFDDVTCCVSVDYLIRPINVFTEVARVLRPGGRFVVTISNRCFPTKAIEGWLATDDRGHVEIVMAYFEASQGFGPVNIRPCAPGTRAGDLLIALIATVR
jgi:SAM-dependent methyltransferase